MKKHIPNMLTCCNLICGCMATNAAFTHHYRWALVMILAGAAFDFFDGMVARLLGVSSEIGKELDSLADVVTFGVAPSAILFYLFTHVHYPDFCMPVWKFFPFSAVLLAAFSALRLAKFNLDSRQTSSFIGLPTPANALFWGSLVAGQHAFFMAPGFNVIYLFLAMLFSCYLLVAELPLFSLKFKDVSWKHNSTQYIFLFGCLFCLPLGWSALAAMIVWYVLLALVVNFQNRRKA